MSKLLNWDYKENEIPKRNVFVRKAMVFDKLGLWYFMKKNFILLLILFSFELQGQNLIGNHSFETYSQCPYDLDQVFLANGWENWCATPDYYNECTTIWGTDVPLNWQGFQYAASGQAYAGVFTYWSHHIGNNQNVRDYVATQLTSPLTIGQNYFVQFKVSLSDLSTCGSSAIGALFTTQSFAQYGDVSFTSPLTANFAHINNAQPIYDTSNWITVSGSLIADSAYNYIVIGNFYDDAHTDTPFITPPYCYVYFYLDDVHVSAQTSTGILEANKNCAMNIFPNPVSDLLKLGPSDLFTGDEYKATIYNCEGKEEEQFDVSANQIINVSHLPLGFHILNVVAGGK
ncbi:MAG TPA: T9SS type A sorting domain-containing protein, partial [Cyclobacteriaceae bacterium]|nr:T9SS type A sorting domain-containing protein [Cyclobacteriaceae bacterium]